MTRDQMFAPAVEGTGRTQAALQRFWPAGNFRIIGDASALVSIESRGSAQIRSPVWRAHRDRGRRDGRLAGYRQSQNEVWAALRERVRNCISWATLSAARYPARDHGRLPRRWSRAQWPPRLKGPDTPSDIRVVEEHLGGAVLDDRPRFLST